MLALAVTTGALGAVLTVVLPLNKRLWTPSYVLVTAAVSIAVLVAFYLVMDIRGVVRPFAPLTVLGQNDRALPPALRGDFQDLPAWRQGVYKVLDLALTEHDGTIHCADDRRRVGLLR